MKLLTLAAVASLAASAAFAAGSHDHSHDHSEGEHGKMMAVGMPGKADAVDRTIDVIMRETEDGDMIFEPSEFDIKQGETIRFLVSNKGELEHEFVIDSQEGNAKHKEMMAQMEMEHDDPNSVSLEPGESGEVVWKFANAGAFEFACLIPGHYESGMHGPINVADTMVERIYTKGVVKKIKPGSGKVTIIHEELVEHDMPAMTMVFPVADDAMLDALSEGQKIEFVADRLKGKLTITDLK